MTDAGPKAPPGNQVFALSDSVRAIAILGVIACHVSPVAIHRRWWGELAWNGQAGVEVFFVLSAFLLYRPYLAARADGRPFPSTWKFLRRRALRILPAYWAALTVLALWPGLNGVFSGHWWRYYLLLQVYPGATPNGGLVVAWSLCVEVSFYLLLPVYASLMAHVSSTTKGRRWVSIDAALLLVLAVVSMLVRYGASVGQIAPWLNGALPGFLDYFVVGMGLALASVVAERSERGVRWTSAIGRFPGVILGLAAAVYVAMCLRVPAPDPKVPALHLAPSPLSFRYAEANYWARALIAALLLSAVVFGDSRHGLSRRILGARPVLALGIISYGVYLWHDPLLGVIARWVGTRPWTWLFGTAVSALFVLTMAAAVPAAMLSYRYVEIPFLRRRYSSSRWVQPPPRPATPHLGARLATSTRTRAARVTKDQDHQR